MPLSFYEGLLFALIDRERHMANGNAVAKRRPGRPSALTPDTEAMILNAIRCGSSYRSACVAAGVGERSFHRWKSKGQEEGAPSEYRRFWQALTRAEHEGQIARLAVIQKASRVDWRAAAWLAERMEPERLSIRYRVEHSARPMTVAEALAQLRDRRPSPKLLKEGGK